MPAVTEAPIVEASAPTETPSAEAPAAEAPTEAAGVTPPEQSFGAALALADTTPLADISRDPAHFSGQVVRTSGEIASVCQRAGCWMELRDEGVEPIRVPMAGHAFFLPRDVSGRRATLEGTVSVRELPQDERDHLASEGALATAQTLQITATGVLIH